MQGEAKAIVIPHSFPLLRSHGLRRILDCRDDRVLALRGLRPKVPLAAEQRGSIGAEIRRESEDAKCRRAGETSGLGS